MIRVTFTSDGEPGRLAYRPEPDTRTVWGPPVTGELR